MRCISLPLFPPDANPRDESVVILEAPKIGMHNSWRDTKGWVDTGRRSDNGEYASHHGILIVGTMPEHVNRKFMKYILAFYLTPRRLAARYN